MPTLRNARVEASARLPGGYEARVLEPSPPADTDPDWFADDPTDPGDAAGKLVTPIPGEGVTWTELIGERGDLAGYAADHWLGGYRRLGGLPDEFAAGRRALHQLAFFAVAPKRYSETGKLALRYTHRGFGTPFFGADEQVRVERNMLVYQQGGEVRSVPLTTLGAATDFLGIEYREVWFDAFHDPLPPVGSSADVRVDRAVNDAIGDFYGFATSVLEEIRRTPGAVDVGRVQLWPEHFDSAVEMGSHGRRASYGASPGDDGHPEPYLYVAAWGEIDRGDDYWNDTTFNGASLSYQELLAAHDQRQAALAFLRRGHTILTR